MKREIDPQRYFGNREIRGTIPKHFIRSHTYLTDEAYVWVVKKLSGRFSVSVGDISPSNFSFDSTNNIYFEDPKEAMIYELRWSGSN